MTNRIIIVDDDRDYLEILMLKLKKAGYGDILCVDHPLEAAAQFDAGATFDIALIDVTMPELDGMQLLEIIKNTSPNTECIMITAVNEARISVKCLKKGAYDYLVKPVREEELLKSIDRALERKRLLDILDMDKRDALPKVHNKDAFRPIITHSRKMIRILKEAELHAASHFPVLITGESGTGKELLARAVHAASPRDGQPFTPVNMAALNSNLFDAEFFGHTKGAFTGAEYERTGYLEQTNGGTLFLDEIGILPLELQGKLLRVLQNGEYMKLGTSLPRQTDVRIIAATNEDLDRLIRQRHFRKDLYYRIRGAWLHLPPLRERREDIPFLIAAMLGRTNGGASRDAISEEALDVLMHYEYPGNVRELESIIHSAASLAQGQAIDAKHLHPKLQPRKPLTLNECRSNSPAVTTLAEAEKCHILQVYEKTGRNKTQSAKILGIGLNTLRRKLKTYGLRNDDA
ncbi:MAG: sigma-54 dependent transcriptional regulator [Desulfobacterales bacterium]|nr:sigma-54 dependent transcriptional regulator [Desulfobacterales bacterium]